MLDFNSLEILISFQENKTLLKTAEVMHISQPALTVSMKKLEKDLSTPIFERSKNKLLLNDTGLYLVSLARNLIKEKNDMLIKVKTYNKSHTTLNVGMSAIAPSLYYLPNIIKKYDIKIIHSLEKEDLLIKDLKNNKYDFIFITKKVNHDKYECKKIFSETLYFFLPKNHPLAKKKTISFKDMDGESLLMNREVGFWDKLVRDNMPNSHFILQDNLDNLRLLVDNSSIASFASNLTIRERVVPSRVAIKISDKSAAVNFYLMYRKNINKEYVRYFT